MMNKPINAKTHGIIDYAFATVQMVGPVVLGLKKSTCITDIAMATGILSVNVFSNTPVAIQKIISLKDHKKADAGFLMALSVITLLKLLKGEQKALVFHTGLLLAGITNYAFTDFNDRSK